MCKCLGRNVKIGGILWTVLCTPLMLVGQADSASISGTITKADGQSLESYASIDIHACTTSCGGACISYTFMQDDDTYTIDGLQPGEYFIYAGTTQFTSVLYDDEWWTSTGSSSNCLEAEIVTISNESDVVTGKNFQIDRGTASIIGTVKDDTGQPVAGVSVWFFTGDPCDVDSWWGFDEETDENGEYVITGIGSGWYKLKGGRFWTASGGSVDCNHAEGFYIKPGEVLTKNFGKQSEKFPWNMFLPAITNKGY